MRHTCLVFALILLACDARAADLRPIISHDAGRCAAAWQHADCQAIVSFLPPQVIKQSGGRAAVLRELNDDFAQARALGAEQLETIPGAPAVPKLIGRWLTSLVPVTAIVHGPHLDLTQSTHVMALSLDQGRHWFFVLLYGVSQAEWNAWFPEFHGKVVLPPTPEPHAQVVF
jgi:hypothetical protein